MIIYPAIAAGMLFHKLRAHISAAADGGECVCARCFPKMAAKGARKIGQLDVYALLHCALQLKLEQIPVHLTHRSFRACALHFAQDDVGRGHPF